MTGLRRAAARLSSLVKTTAAFLEHPVPHCGTFAPLGGAASGAGGSTAARPTPQWFHGARCLCSNEPSTSNATNHSAAHIGRARHHKASSAGAASAAAGAAPGQSRLLQNIDSAESLLEEDVTAAQDAAGGFSGQPEASNASSLLAAFEGSEALSGTGAAVEGAAEAAEGDQDAGGRQTEPPPAPDGPLPTFDELATAAGKGEKGGRLRSLPPAAACYLSAF